MTAVFYHRGSTAAMIEYSTQNFLPKLHRDNRDGPWQGLRIYNLAPTPTFFMTPTPTFFYHFLSFFMNVI
jgi:hypothetical protein